MRSLIVTSLCLLAASQDLFLQAPVVSPPTVSADEIKALEILKGFAANVGGPGPKPDIPCMMEHCLKELTMCVASAATGDKCLETLKCNNDCSSSDDGHNRAPGCAYLCEMTTGYTSEVYTKMIECMGERHHCLPIYPDDGDCLATDADAMQNITTLDQLEGDWWVVKGINCGQVSDGTPFTPKSHPGPLPSLNPTKGRNFPGGYDWYPCQHERFVKSNGHDYPFPTTPWVNNITYCGGANGGIKECATNIIDTVANVTMCAPGVVCHNYVDSPLKPQFEHWRIVSMPHPDYIASIWCGGTPLVTYNGGITLVRNKKNLDDMPKWVEENFRATYKRFGVDWDQMCPSSNENCP